MSNAQAQCSTMTANNNNNNCMAYDWSIEASSARALACKEQQRNRNDAFSTSPFWLLQVILLNRKILGSSGVSCAPGDSGMSIANRRRRHRTSVQFCVHKETFQAAHIFASIHLFLGSVAIDAKDNRQPTADSAIGEKNDNDACAWLCGMEHCRRIVIMD